MAEGLTMVTMNTMNNVKKSLLALFWQFPSPSQQIYNNTEKQYSYRDKYYGRSLDREGFILALKEFVYDGSSYRTDIIPKILHSLHKLRDLIEKQNGFRFYSSSLLLLYDGDQAAITMSTSPVPNTFVRMIDFAHTTCPLEGYQTDPVQYSGPDEGYVLGLNSLITFFQSHLDQLLLVHHQ